MVFHDLNENNFKDDGGEYPLTAVVEISEGSCSNPSFDSMGTLFGAAKFSGLTAGTYCLKAINSSVDIGSACEPVPVVRNGNKRTIHLNSNQDKEFLSNGFAYKCR